MRQRLSFIALFAFLGVFGALVQAQDFIIDEEGNPKLVFDDPLQPMELFFGTKYPVGEKNFARSFKPEDPAWTLTPMPKEKYLALNELLAKVKKGQVDAVAGFKPEGLASIPYIWNLMREQKAVQEAVAPHAVQLEGPNGDALTYSLLLSDLPSVRETAFKKMKSRLTPDAIFGVWLRSQGPIRDRIASDMIDKKDMKAFQDHRDKFNGKDEWKKVFDKKIPTFIQNLYIDSLIDKEYLPFKVSEKEEEKFFKEFNAALGKGKADKEWMTLASLRVGDKVSTGDLEKISRHKDWYLRWTLCRALRHRPDLNWDVTPLLLERQRDECVMIRLEANRTLRALHHLPYEFKPQRTLKLDSEVVAAWERWWILREDTAKLLKDSEKWPVTELKPEKNLKVFFGSSPQNFNALIGNVDKPFKSKVTLIDVNKDGDYTDWGVDRIGFGNVEKEPTLLLSRVVSSGSALWLLEPDEKKLTVRFKEYQGKSAKVKFTPRYEPDYDPVGITVSSSPDMNFLVNLKGETLLPLGDYFINAGWILRKGGEVARMELNKKAPPIRVNGSALLEVPVGSELCFQLEAEHVKDKNQIVLKPVDVIGAAGELYMKINPQLDTIAVTVYADDKKDNTSRIWNSHNLQMTTQMVGGLVPPMKDETIMADRVNYEEYIRKEIKIHTDLTPKKQVKEGEKTQKDAEKVSKETELKILEAKPAPTDDEKKKIAELKDAIQKLVDEIKVVDADIATLAAEILKLETENSQTMTFLQGDAGLSGRTFDDYIEAIFKEEGCKLLAKSLSDISWKPFPIDMGKVNGAAEASVIKVILRNTTIPFGKMQEKEILIELKSGAEAPQ